MFHRLILLAGLTFLLASVRMSLAAERPPNFVILYADDLGYGDLSCYGHPTIRTPALDRMAAEGMRFTQFYSAAPVCTPSRAALMTGRYPVRNGMAGNVRRVLFPDSKGGIPDDEITIAEALKSKGYATACIGKWHLGHLPPYLPTRHGFDSYFGIPYSNDMKPTPLMRNEKTIEEPAVQDTLTPRYTQEALQFIQANKERPFFLYVPYTFPHVPIFASPRFKGTSLRGLYGDVIEELDWSVGEILKALRAAGVAEQTMVFFSSDNGPWLIKNQEGGSAGLLRDGKGSTWEGGMREPAIFWWPGQIAAGAVNREVGSMTDLLPTLLALAGAEPIKDRPLDGQDISPALLGKGSIGPRVIFYYDGLDLMAVRKGPWKGHLITRAGYGPDRNKPQRHSQPVLYNLDVDPSEKYDISKDHPDVTADLLKEVERHQRELKPAVSQLDSSQSLSGAPTRNSRLMPLSPPTRSTGTAQ
ncbi:MAG: sulfatase [Phycisphaerae bacterium]